MAKFEMVYYRDIPGLQDEDLPDLNHGLTVDDRFDEIALKGESAAEARAEALAIWRIPRLVRGEQPKGYWVVETETMRIVGDEEDADPAVMAIAEREFIVAPRTKWPIPVPALPGNEEYFRLVIEVAQGILADHLEPDSGISAQRCVNQLVEVLDDEELVKRLAMSKAPEVSGRRDH